MLVYDENQIMNKSQIWTDDAFLKLEHEANLKGNLITLHNQMRIHATKETVEWIRNLIDAGVVNEVPIDNDYDIRVLTLLRNFKVQSWKKMIIRVLGFHA